MILAPIIVIFAGYTAASYGLILMKSWEIPFRAWVSPLHPYQWPADGSPPPKMPAGQLLPGGAIAGGGGISATPPPGVTPSTWEQFLECLSRGGLCTPGQYLNIGGGVLKKLFGI